MALRTTGTLSELDIAAEFGAPAAPTFVSLNDYHKGLSNGYVVATTLNSNIPSGNGSTIKISDFYGSARYASTATITVTDETPSQYNTNNNGSCTVTCVGTAPSYSITINGINYITTTGVPVVAAGLNSEFPICTVMITDVRGTHGPFVFYVGLSNPPVSRTRSVNLLNE